MREHRKERLESTMEQLLAKEIVKTLEVTNQLITITSVEIDEKLECARVHVQVFPDTDKQAVLDTLERNARQLQHYLLKQIPIKKIPHLEFE